MKRIAKEKSQREDGWQSANESVYELVGYTTNYTTSDTTYLSMKMAYRSSAPFRPTPAQRWQTSPSHALYS